MTSLTWPLFIAAFYFGYKTLAELMSFIGLASGSDSTFWMLLFLACTVALVWAGRKASTGASQPNGQVGGWLAQFPNARYSHHASKTGIALDDQTRVIHLLEGKISKSYSYDDVRSWNTNIQTGGVVYGGGVAGALGTIGAGMDNANNTGLFITVKDVDHPEWRIRLCKPNHRDIRKIHAKWMEILKQTINLDKPTELQPAQFSPSVPTNMLHPNSAALPRMSHLPEAGSKVFCPECGAANVSSSKFCKSCGQVL